MFLLSPSSPPGKALAQGWVAVEHFYRALGIDEYLSAAGFPNCCGTGEEVLGPKHQVAALLTHHTPLTAHPTPPPSQTHLGDGKPSQDATTFSQPQLAPTSAFSTSVYPWLWNPQ